MKLKKLKIKIPSLQDVMDLLEEGKLYRYIQGGIIAAIVLGVLISGIEFSSGEVTKIFESESKKQYHIKKVSQIPKEKEKEEAEKLAVEDDRMTEEQLKERYYSYVVNKIEYNKQYPADEQKKGHEGSIVLKLYINRDGKIDKVRIIRQARYMKLTKAAIMAIKKSLPFKAYSTHIKDDMLILKLELKFALTAGS